MTAVCPGERIATGGCGLCRECRPQPGEGIAGALEDRACAGSRVSPLDRDENNHECPSIQVAFLSFTPGFLFDNIEVGSPSYQSAETEFMGNSAIPTKMS